MRHFSEAVLRKVHRNAGHDVDRLFIQGGFAVVALFRLLLALPILLVVGVLWLLTQADQYLQRHQNVNGATPCPSSESRTKKTAESASAAR